MKFSNFYLFAETYVFASYTGYCDVTLVYCIQIKYKGKPVAGYASKVAT